MSGIAEVRSALLKYGAAFGMFIFVFAIALVQPFVRLAGSPASVVRIDPAGSGVNRSVGERFRRYPALIIAAAVTLIILACCECTNAGKMRQPVNCFKPANPPVQYLFL